MKILFQNLLDLDLKCIVFCETKKRKKEQNDQGAFYVFS